MDPISIAKASDVVDRVPVGAMVDGIDLVIIRRGEEHSVLYENAVSTAARC